MEKKRVVIVGAGVSGLTVCKHLLELGCRPVVFEGDTVLGGVWARAPACTELQTPRPMYQYSDFPWPETVTEVFPNHRQVVAYLDAYARHFGVLGCIRFAHRVVGMEYHGGGGGGVSEQDMDAWEEWAGNGQAFGSGAGEWRLSVADADGHVETHKADFVVLCMGRFSGIPNIPTFPAGKGPEVFDGQVIHSMDYAKMGASKAKEMIRGKRVTVVGYLKSALDIAAECAEVNGTAHPCTMVVRTKHWILPDYFAWGFHISKLYLNRFSELLIHKPGEGLLLSILATLLTPLRSVFSKFAESYYSIPMKKHDMVPDHSLFEALAAATIAITPKDHYKRLDEGSIVLKKSKTFSFCKEGVVVEGETSPVKSDVVIFGTGFKGDDKIKNMFTSVNYFRHGSGNLMSSVTAVWCRRTDELVDGPNANYITPTALDRWEKRLEDLFAGRPYDMLDAALSDTISRFPIDIQPFRDMIEGMRSDLRKTRYNNFDELYMYCYYVAGTVGLMSVPVMGIAPESKATTESVYSAALALGIANQLTNILRDVGEDATRGRIYLPQDELAQAGLSDEDIFKGVVTNRWRNFMKRQIKRARMFFEEAERGVTELSQASRWPVWASLLLYRQILDEIEANDYNNFTKRAYVGKGKKLLALPVAYGKSLLLPCSLRNTQT